MSRRFKVPYKFTCYCTLEVEIPDCNDDQAGEELYDAICELSFKEDILKSEDLTFDYGDYEPNEVSELL